MKIIEVYGVNEFERGTDQAIYSTPEYAARAAKGRGYIGGNAEIHVRKAIVDENGLVYLLDPRWDDPQLALDANFPKVEERERESHALEVGRKAQDQKNAERQAQMEKHRAAIAKKPIEALNAQELRLLGLNPKDFNKKG